MGSTFTFSFDAGDVDGIPLCKPKTAGQSSASAATGADQQRDLALAAANVLLVEDGDTNRKLIKLLLEKAGAQVATAENGEVGCQIALRQPFDVILMDMQMPVLDGYSASRRLRDAGLILPIIALTAHAMAGDREKCLEAGCSDYLMKPIDADRMIDVIEKWLPTPTELAARTSESDGADGPNRDPKNSPSPA